MRRLKYFLAGSLIFTGISIALICLVGFFWSWSLDDPQAQVDERTMAIGSFLILGAPPIVLGSALWWTTQQRDQALAAERLKNTFFHVLQQAQGRISVLDFAMAAKLDGDAAKLYLDDQAREFNANFDVNAEGAVLYCFDTALPANATLQPTEPEYDVILQDYPTRQRQAIAAAILRLSDLSDSQVKEAVRNAKKRPVAIAQGFSQVAAEGLRERLEELGATVLVILR
jgi:ribosomal protein L7/L12